MDFPDDFLPEDLLRYGCLSDDNLNTIQSPTFIAKKSAKDFGVSVKTLDEYRKLAAINYVTRDTPLFTNLDDALSRAVRIYDLELIALFINEGARNWDAALLAAIEWEHSDLAEYFITGGTNNIDDAIVKAEEKGLYNIVKLLADQKNKAHKKIIWILIASTGDQLYLHQTLESVKRLTKTDNFRVAVSLYSTTSFNEKGVVIYRRTEPLHQFDHYELLSKELPINDDDQVVLLDDDDIILPSALSYVSEGSHVGLQILIETNLLDNISISLEKEPIIMETELLKNVHKDRIVDDLSGTVTNGKYFKDYFRQRKNLFNSVKYLEDTYYMKYVESLPNFTVMKRIIILHRVKDTPSLWMDKLVKGIREDFRSQ